jgi:hypothetical protein
MSAGIRPIPIQSKRASAIRSLNVQVIRHSAMAVAASHLTSFAMRLEYRRLLFMLATLRTRLATDSWS